MPVPWCPQGFAKWSPSPGGPGSLSVRPVLLIHHPPPDLCGDAHSLVPQESLCNVTCSIQYTGLFFCFYWELPILSPILPWPSLQLMIKALRSFRGLLSSVIYLEKCPVVWVFWNYSVFFFLFFFFKFYWNIVDLQCCVTFRRREKWFMCVCTCVHTYIWIKNIYSFLNWSIVRGLSGGVSGEESTCNAGNIRDMALISGSRKSPGGGNGNLLQSSCLENPMDRRTWWAIVHGVAKEL